MLVLGLTLAVLVLALWWVKRTTLGNAPKGQGVEVLQQLALGNRERLLCVRVHGVKMLLGITAQNISTLHVFEPESPTARRTEGVVS